MIFGRGRTVGPDLSNICRELSLQELEQAITSPDARIRPGYELVTVKLRDNATLRGFARVRSNFDLVLQDLEGRLRSIPEREIAAINDVGCHRTARPGGHGVSWEAA